MEGIKSCTALGLELRGQPLLYKFIVGSRSAVPSGIPKVGRESDRKVDQRHAEEAKAEGRDRAAMEGRVRPDRVDTGTAVYQREEGVHIASVRSLLALRGYRLADAHFFVKPGYGKRPRDTAIIVARLAMGEKPIGLKDETIEGLRALARENHWTTHVWDNGLNRPSTINFTSRQQGRPEQMMVMRDGFLRLEPTPEVFEARQIELEEDAKVGEELLSNIRVLVRRFRK